MKDIIGYEGRYGITKEGKIWNYRREHWLNPTKEKEGYLVVSLRREKRRQYRVHRLVAQAFIQNSKNLPDVNHKNGVKTDNRSRNLEWCTSSFNIRHAIRTGLRDHRGERNWNHRWTKQQILEMRRQYSGKYGQLSELARKFHTTPSRILEIVTRKTWKHV